MKFYEFFVISEVLPLLNYEIAKFRKTAQDEDCTVLFSESANVFLQASVKVTRVKVTLEIIYVICS